MDQYRTSHASQARRPSTPSPMLIDVQICQPRHDCPIYAWERECGCMRLTDIYRAEPGLPADLATFQLEGTLDVPILLVATYSAPPGTLVQARLLGALSFTSSRAKERTFPTDDWVFVAVAEVDTSLSPYQSIEMLPPAQVASLKAYVQTKAREELQQSTGEVQPCDADMAARLIRETRLLLKRERRMQPKGKGWLKREEEERPVAWRAIEGLAEALRAQIQKEAFLQDGTTAPHAQAEQLIRFVPQRFQHALADLLLDDERLLAFVERPLLRHRTGWLGMQTWRSNEGLFLVTDRQVLWLRDFLAPGSNFLPGGYIAHMAPLERLQQIALLAAGSAPGEFAHRLESDDSPYSRLVMEVASVYQQGELFVVEFPQKPEMEKVLARINGTLRAFLPYLEGTEDRRVRRLPAVEVWMPRGVEAERLAGLGGIVPAAIAQRLEQRLARLLNSEEELLASALVPALEDYKSPARLVALTRDALLVLEDASSKSHRSTGEQEHVHRYDLAAISSAQLRYSLLGSSLSIFVPEPGGRARQHVFPFHSPAIAWFLPLFTRLRILLSGPYRTS